MISGTTVAKGTKTIRMKTTGHEKSKVSVCLTANADGKRLKPFTVLTVAKREVKELNEHFKRKCFLASTCNGWMNDELTAEYLREIVGKFSFSKRLLIWDSVKAHISDSTKRLQN